MLTYDELGGLMAMMPSFTTDDASDLRATSTVDVERLRKGVDRMVRDGANVIATTGSFGECHTLLPDEFATLARETADTVDQRVPLFVGVVAENARIVVERMRVVNDTKAQGVMVGIPYYFPSTLPNAVRFVRELAEMFPRLAILIYHNPEVHRITLTVDAFNDIVKIRNVVAMKDSHRDTLSFMRIQKLVKGKIAVFCNQQQYFPYAQLGAKGFWSIDAWLGPWPQFALRDAVKRGDWDAAREIAFEFAPRGKADLAWRESGSKLAMNFAGYVEAGPLRAPFLEIPDEQIEAQRKRAERWKALCAKYAPAYQTVR